MFMSQGHYQAVAAPSSLMRRHLAAMMDPAVGDPSVTAEPAYETGLRALYNPRQERVMQQLHRQPLFTAQAAAAAAASSAARPPPLSATLRQQSQPNFHFSPSNQQKVQVRRKYDWGRLL